MGTIFCSSVALVWTFNTKGVYNFITKEPNISVNLVPFFVVVLFQFYRFLKIWSTEWAEKSFSVKEQKHHRYLFQTGQNFAAHKTRLVNICMEDPYSYNFFKKEYYRVANTLNQAQTWNMCMFFQLFKHELHMFFQLKERLYIWFPAFIYYANMVVFCI